MPTNTIDIITPECWVCHGRSHVGLTPEEYEALNARDEQGRPAHLIQDALPNRDADFRELVKTGIHPECWATMFPEED